MLFFHNRQEEILNVSYVRGQGSELKRALSWVIPYPFTQIISVHVVDRLRNAAQLKRLIGGLSGCGSWRRGVGDPPIWVVPQTLPLYTSLKFKAIDRQRKPKLTPNCFYSPVNLFCRIWGEQEMMQRGQL